MKKNLFALLLIGALSVTAVLAQQHRNHDKTNQPERIHKPGSDKFKAMKIAYLTDKLSLTPEEAQKFWPIYNEYESKKKSDRMVYKAERKEMDEGSDPTDAEIEKMLNAKLQLKQDELDLEKEYLAKFKTVLPMKKISALYKAEDSFKRDLLRKMRTPPTTPPPTPPVAPKGK